MDELETVDPHATTPGGLPYPLPTDPLTDGANAIKNLALAIEPKLAGEMGYSERVTPLALSGAYVDTGLSVTFAADGTSRYFIEVFWPFTASAGGNTVSQKVVIDGADSGILSANNPNAGWGPIFAKRRLPALAAGNHTVKIQAISAGGGVGPLQAGDGAGANYVPAYLRVTKA